MFKKALGTIVISLGLASGPALGASLVTDATIATVRNTWFYTSVIQVTLASGQGPCASTTISYVESSQGNTSAEESSLMDRHLGVLLSAKLAGKKVSIDGASCSDARVTLIK
jgi:hypothetical protein